MATATISKAARYAPFGPVTQWTWNNGRTLQRPVDLDYRTTQVYDSAAGGLSTGYHYDAVGNVDQLWDGMLSTQQAGYDYDDLDRLTVTRGQTHQPVESYGYDATGNRTSFTNSTGTQAYAYPTTSHQLSSIAGSVRSYDLAGNTTANAATGYQYLYDGAGRMKQSKLNSVVQMNYRYNGKGERTRQFPGDATTTSTYTVYDEQGHWLGDYNANGGAKQQAIWLGDLPVGLLVGSGTSQQLDYIEADHLGTPRVVIDPDRDVAVWKWDAKSEAFGNTTPTQDPDNDGTVFVFDMRFPGQRYDAASGLNYNYFRDYDPASGRYPQSDPIGLMGGVTTYAYTRNQPTTMIDPLGLQSSTMVTPGMTGAAGAYNPNNANPGSPPPSSGWSWPESQPRPKPMVEVDSGDRLAEAIYKASPLNALSELEKAISNQLNGVCDEEEDKCEEQALKDEQMCRMATLPGTPPRARCWESANERFGACKAKRPLPRLVIW